MIAESHGTPNGYKRTEVGLIPDDWECKSIGELFREGVIEKPMDGNHGAIHPKSGDFVHSGIPFVMANDVQHGRVDFQRCSFICKKQADSLMKGFAKQGDVLLTHKATMGNTAIVGEIAWDYIMLTPQVTYYRVANHERLSNRYLRHFFDGSAFQHRLEVLSGGGTRSYLGIVGQHKLPVALPPTLAEQEAIAEALGDADALIESLEQLVAKKRHLKQATMQQLLTGKKRLPGFEQDETVAETELGTFPSDWSLRPLHSLIDPSRGIRYGIVQPGKFEPNGRYMIRGQDYSEAKGWANPTEVFRVSDVIEQRYRNARVKSGDIIMTIVGYCGHVEMVPQWLDGANLTQTTARIAIHADKAVPAFCKYVLQSEIGKKQVASHIKGAAQPGLNCGDIEHFLLSIPQSAEEQNAIAAIVSDMDAEIEATEAKLAKVRQIKLGMMQELLTGRIRLV